MKYQIPDLDIDMSIATRNEVISVLPHIPASKINNKGINPHNIGIYFCDIPMDKISGLASIDYKRAEEELGYQKVDILHNSVYDNFSSRKELFDTLEKPIIWSKLYDKDIVETLPHINGYYDLLKELPKINSIEELAMMIAVVRPAKKYLIETVKQTQSWKSIEDKIWVKEGDGYMYKKAHSFSYSLMISLLLRK